MLWDNSALHWHSARINQIMESLCIHSWEVFKKDVQFHQRSTRGICKVCMKGSSFLHGCWGQWWLGVQLWDYDVTQHLCWHVANLKGLTKGIFRTHKLFKWPQWSGVEASTKRERETKIQISQCMGSRTILQKGKNLTGEQCLFQHFAINATVRRVFSMFYLHKYAACFT